MSPLNRGAMVGSRAPPSMRPPMPRFGGRGLMPPMRPVGRGVPPPMMYGAPLPGPGGRIMPPPRPGPMMGRPGGPGAPPMFRGRPIPPPIPPMPPMVMRGPMGPRGPMMPRPGPRGVLPPHALPHHMRPRLPPNVNGKSKTGNGKKGTKLEELELKKPWMTDEIRCEIQKKNKLYAKAKKNKDAKEWEEFKDLRNKVTRMIRDAKNDYLQKNPDQAHLYENDEPEEDNNDDDINELYSDSEEESAENTNVYCEVCDREFQSDEMLERHIQEHQTCNIDGCTFTAHPKIVEKHISMQHSTGLYSRMKNLMSDGDIEKWKAERKRRYPTAANNKLKEAEQTEKEKRGEVIQSNQNQKNRRPCKTDNKKDIRKNRKRRQNKAFKARMEVNEETIEKETYRGLLPFAGTAILDETEQSDNSSVEKSAVENVEDSKFEVSDEEETEQKLNDENSLNVDAVEKSVDETPKTKDVAPQVLSLVADYGSDSDNDELPEEVPIKRLKLDEDENLRKNELLPKLIEINNFQNNVYLVENSSTSVCDNRVSNLSTTVDNCFQSKVDAKEDLCLSTCDKKLVVSNKSRKEIDEKSSGKNKKKLFEDKKKLYKNKHNNAEFSNTRLNLLNKLLARSIQHERNTIFQCITFIANNNFFD